MKELEAQLHAIRIAVSLIDADSEPMEIRNELALLTSEKIDG